MATNRLALAAIVVLAFSATAFACSVPPASCKPAKCNALATPPSRNDPKMGFYYGLWNNVTYPNKTAFNGGRGGPYVNFEVFVVSLAVDSETVF